MDADMAIPAASRTAKQKGRMIFPPPAWNSDRGPELRRNIHHFQDVCRRTANSVLGLGLSRKSNRGSRRAAEENLVVGGVVDGYNVGTSPSVGDSHRSSTEI